MKRIFCLILSISLFAITSIACAEFDYSIFPTDRYTVTIDEFDGTGLIVPADKSILQFTHSKSSKYKSIISPALTVGENENYFALAMLYYADTWLFIDKLYFKLADDVYVFDVSAERETASKGDILEYIIIMTNDEKVNGLLDAWVQYEGEIRVRIHGSKGNVDFTLDSKIQEFISEFYRLFREAETKG